MGHKHALNVQLLHMGKKEVAAREPIVPPRGCMSLKVGGEGEEQQKFVVPVIYLDHPLFLSMLKEAEEEYGFEHKGAISIPCHVEYFRQVQGIINRDTSGSLGSRCRGHYHQHHSHFLRCFRA